MEDNSSAFHAAAANVFVALSLPEASTWSGIGDRLSMAEQAERDHANITADIETHPHADKSANECAYITADQCTNVHALITTHKLTDDTACPWWAAIS